jgi:hypothetical protein
MALGIRRRPTSSGSSSLREFDHAANSKSSRAGTYSVSLAGLQRKTVTFPLVGHTTSFAEKSFQITGLYESELLVELMLRFWEHPFADNMERLAHELTWFSTYVGGEEREHRENPRHARMCARIARRRIDLSRSRGPARRRWRGTISCRLQSAGNRGRDGDSHVEHFPPVSMVQKK